MIFSRFSDRLKSWQKTTLAIVFDFTITIVAFYLSFVLRLGEFFPELIRHAHFIWLVLLMGLSQTATFYLNGLYKGLWRYSSTPDLLRVIRASVYAIIVSFIVGFIFIRLEGIPRSLFFINWLLLVMGVGGGRLFYRVFRDRAHQDLYLKPGEERSRVFIVGAGDGGDRLFREIKRDDSLQVNIVGFIDDAQGLQNRSLHNTPVLGTTENLVDLIEQYQVHKVFIAIPSATSKQIRRIYEKIKDLPSLEIKILPKMSDILQGKIEFTKLEEIKIEDLLGREEVELDLDPIKEMLQGKRVLVTGAGGSIGSELCEQLAHFQPSRLIALDISEFNIYQLDQKLKERHENLNFYACIGDVREPSTIDFLFEKERPQVILHAAAYKHVPLMEFNPFECVRTNVFGTKVVCEASIKFQAERLILISTDKAVNPTNVMGATKRVAEMVVENLNKRDIQTKLIAVRFGNVLGSSGSVIPLFRRQIKSGGPITVTHEEITRYFMSIPEASKLVLQASAIGLGGELFVLDMGEPVKIMQMAKEMISLAGLHEGVDIDIIVTGLRPGEKLYEEPLMDLESSLSTPHPKVKICKAREVSSSFQQHLEALVGLHHHSSREVFVKSLREVVPEYKPFKNKDPLVG